MKKSETYGVIGSAILTGSIILLLFLFVMPGLQKPEEDEGIMVSFGETDMGAGQTMTPSPEPTVRATTPPPAAPKTTKEEVLTQDNNSLAIAQQKKKEKQEKEALERQRLEQQRLANEKKRKEQEAIEKANAMNGLFGNSNSQGSGTTSGDTRQGNPAGQGNSGGNSWSLSGRSLEGSLVSPSYDSDVEGYITVEIIVDKNGNVINTSIGSHTITDPAIRNAARTAAKRTRFSAGNDISKGKIIYNFKLR